MAAHPGYTCKLIIVGETNVGKSCLLFQFTEGTFNPFCTMTVGAEFGVKSVEIDGHEVSECCSAVLTLF